MSEAQAVGAPVLRRKPIYQDLSFQVAAGIVLGVLVGIFFPQIGEHLHPLGDGFIKLIRMLIAPIIFCTVVHGIASIGEMKKVGRVALKALIYFEVMTTIALLVGLLVVNIWRPGDGMNVDVHALNPATVKVYTTAAQHADAIDFLMNIIPKTFIGAFSEGNLLGVLLLAILFGSVLPAMGKHGEPIVALIDSLNKALFRVVGVIMMVAPIGAFGAIAFTISKFGAGSLLGLSKLVLCFYITSAIFVGVFMGLAARLAGFSLWKFLRYIREEVLIVFATTTTESVLPQLVRKLELLGCDESVVGLVIPTGYSFNLEGTCLYITTAAVFLAQATNTPFGLSEQIGLVLISLLTAKGSAGVAGAAFVTMAATLSAQNIIPVESIALVIGVHRLMSEALTFTSLVGNGVATMVVAKWDGALDEKKMHHELNAL
ncbi:MAG TPA: C4-dicarboxylate transporter DctA [Pseudolabrys sp.]|jgi:aerobic C4-dicarboxylate transport protein|nr:C4-dicarboxylate transporter DctA [Pseudolabrys sp.]